MVVFITIFICNSQKVIYSDDEKKKDEYYQEYGGKIHLFSFHHLNKGKQKLKKLRKNLKKRRNNLKKVR